MYITSKTVSDTSPTKASATSLILSVKTASGTLLAGTASSTSPAGTASSTSQAVVSSCRLVWKLITTLGNEGGQELQAKGCLLYTSPSPRDVEESRMPSSA